MEDGIDLRCVISSLLNAVQQAQRLGDQESGRLMGIYEKEKVLSAFAVPAFSIAEAEIELRFAVARPLESNRQTGTPGLSVKIGAEALKGTDPAHLQVIKFRITPVPLKVVEVGKKQRE